MQLLNETLSAEGIQELVAGLKPERLPFFVMRRVFDLDESGPAIYFVFHEERIVYIGETGCLKTRWLSHSLRRVRKLRNSYVGYLGVRFGMGMRRRIENALIAHYKPSINKNPTLQVVF